VTGAIGLYVNNDDRQPDRYVVNIVQAGIGLPDESYYREDTFAEIRDAYLAHIQAMLELAGWPDPAGAASRVLEFETRLAASHWDRVQVRDREATYNRHTLAELRALAPSFDWLAWTAAAGVAADDAFAEVIVRQPSYVAAMSDALDEVSL